MCDNNMIVTEGDDASNTMCNNITEGDDVDIATKIMRNDNLIVLRGDVASNNNAIQYNGKR